MVQYSQQADPQPFPWAYQMPQQQEKKPGLMDILSQSLGTGLGEGIAGGIQQQLKRSALDKMLSNINPNMSPQERLLSVASADESTQPILQDYFKQLDKQKEAQAFNQTLQGIYGQPQQEQQNQQQMTQPFAEGQPGQGIGATSGVTDPAYQKILIQAKQHKTDLDQKAQQHQQNQDFQRKQKQIESEEKISTPILQDVETKRASLPTLQNALKIQDQALQEDDLSAFSPDYLAEVFHFEPFRSPSGALFKTAGKEFFLGSINQVGRQPNQWIEQQIYSMAPQIGRSKEANLKVNAFLKFKADADEHDVETKSKLAQDLRNELGFVPANIGSLASQIEKPYLEKREKQLGYQLQKITEAENPDQLEKIVKVRKGTPLTREKAKVFKDYTGGDIDKARKLAVNLGYEIPDAEIIAEGNR